jgi:hypothetical protein
MTPSREETTFWDTGIQYYVAGRAAVLAALNPVYGSLFHHAVESCLKARLSQKYSLKQLAQRQFGHNLTKLWETFKLDFPNENLAEFDDIIADLDRFEWLRYPDAIVKEGAQIGVVGSSSGGEPIYRIDLDGVDKLVARVFQVCSRNPYFFTGRLNDYARDALTRTNPVGAALVRPR